MSFITWDHTYPVRARIIDVTGLPFHDTKYTMNTPKVSKKHIGKEGTAEKMSDYIVKITLDDGNVLYGYECWWEPLD